jgi:hypothetical protein
MSQAQTNAAAPALPDKGTATAFLSDNLYDDAFFNKIASATGVAPTNATEANQLRQWAQKLRAAQELDLAKNASAGGSLISRGLAATDQYLAQHGVTPGKDEEEAFLWKVAQAAGADASVQAAFLALASDELEASAKS